jgi:serine protease Do
LINLRGEVVGINAAIISRSGGSQGIGFAIPSNTVRTALESLLKQGRIIRGYLGIQGVRPQDQNAANGPVVVDDVIPGSPAEEAHLQRGDVIQKFDGQEVKNFQQLRTLVSQVELNKNVDLEILRDGKPLKIAAQIKEQPADYATRDVTRPPDQPQETPPSKDRQPNASGALGAIHVGELTPDSARQLDLPNGVHGVVVTDIDPDSGVAELRKGDVIEEVNQQTIASVADYNKVVSALDPAQPQVLSICRHRARSFLVLRPR